MTPTVWYRISVSKTALDLNVVLRCGQAFRWREETVDSERVWVGVIVDRVWLLRQDDDCIHFKVVPDERKLISIQSSLKSPPTSDICSEKAPQESARRAVKRTRSKTTSIDDLTSSEGDIPSEKCSKTEYNNTDIKERNCQDYPNISDLDSVLIDYFQLKVDLPALYSKWSLVDRNFEEMKTKYPGIRVLRQDPIENLFTFICSSNNHITRITSMVEKLCAEYGDKLCDIEGRSYYSFARVDQLAGVGVEGRLRELGFGYRAGYIYKTACFIMAQKNGVQWMYDLRNESYDVARRSLMSLHGVGAKVADCVCLMSLDKMDSVPVDTHVWQIAKNYLPSVAKQKTLTDKLYREIAEFFRALWGPYAGWAQAVLFAADLPQFHQTKDRKSSETFMPSSD